jgi:hypothetical protein
MHITARCNNAGPLAIATHIPTSTRSLAAILLARLSRLRW